VFQRTFADWGARFFTGQMSITQPVHFQSSVYQDMGQVLFQAQNSPFPQIFSTVVC